MSNPDRDVMIRRFWVREWQMPEHHEVRVSTKPIQASRIVDVDGGQVFEGAPDDIEGFLFFVDEEPAANWAHDCRYVFMFLSGGLAIAHREWPPTEGVYDKLEKVDRRKTT